MEEIYAGREFLLSLGFLILGFFFHAYLTKSNAVAASKQAKAILGEAQKEAEVVRREAKVQAKDAILRARENSERDAIFHVRLRFNANYANRQRTDGGYCTTSDPQGGPPRGGTPPGAMLIPKQDFHKCFKILYQ